MKGHENGDNFTIIPFIPNYYPDSKNSSLVIEKKPINEERKTQLDKVLNPVPRKVVGIIEKSDPVIRNRVDILYNNPKPLNRVIKPNKPDDRQDLINLKNKSINKVLFSTIPNRRTGINPITIGGKSHR